MPRPVGRPRKDETLVEAEARALLTHKARTPLLLNRRKNAKSIKEILPKIFPSTPRKRGGPITAAEQSLVQQFVADQPRDLLPIQISALSTLLQRSELTVKEMVEKAKVKFVSRAESYVDAHHQATQEALADKDYEQALRGAQWAIEHISVGGARIVEKVAAESTSPRVMIGVQVGAIDSDAIRKLPQNS